MDANERVINRLERLYSLFGAGDAVDSLVSVGGHDYRRDIRQGAFRFLNTYLKNDPRAILDTEVDLVTGPREEIHPIAPEKLRVFPTDADIPQDALNAWIDWEFVPMAKVTPPGTGEFESWKHGLLAKLRRITFHHFPERIPVAKPAGQASGNVIRLNTEPGITIRLKLPEATPANVKRAILVVSGGDVAAPQPEWLKVKEGDVVYVCEPRGQGETRWTQKNPPNYTARSHYLLGRTVESGRVWDIAATLRYLRTLHPGPTQLCLAGEGAAAVLAVYGALLEPDAESLILRAPPASLKDGSAPALLNALRVCDVPQAIGMLAPRSVTLLVDQADWAKESEKIYQSADAAGRLTSAAANGR